MKQEESQSKDEEGKVLGWAYYARIVEKVIVMMEDQFFKVYYMRKMLRYIFEDIQGMDKKMKQQELNVLVKYHIAASFPCKIEFEHKTASTSIIKL